MKLTKEQAGYAEPLPVYKDAGPGRGIRCDSCSFWRNGFCVPVEGSIAPGAACNLWSPDNSLALEYWSGAEVQIHRQQHSTYWTKKVHKAAAGYIDNVPEKIQPPLDKGFHCSDCTYFVSVGPLHGCEPVHGFLSPQGCCNLFTLPGEKTEFTWASGAKCVQVLQDIEDLGKK